jgi:hypothetical protein
MELAGSSQIPHSYHSFQYLSNSGVEKNDLLLFMLVLDYRRISVTTPRDDA